MDKCEIKRVFDQVKPTPKQEQAMLDRLFRAQKEVKPMSRMKKMTTMLVAAALLLMACAFTVATGLDQRIVEYFKGEPKDAGLMSAGIVPVEQSHTYDNGWKVEIKQVLMDRNSIAALVELTAPEGIVPELEYRIFDMEPTITNAQGEELLLGGVPRGIPLEDPYPEDNQATILWSYDVLLGVEEMWGGSFTLTPRQFFWSTEEGPVQFSDGWSCTGTLPTEDAGLLYQMDEPFSLAGKELGLKSVYISPIRFVFTLEACDPTMDALHEGRGSVSLTLEDGSIIKMEEGIYSASADQTGETDDCRVLFQPEKLVDPQAVRCVTLYGQTFSLDDLQPVGD